MKTDLHTFIGIIRYSFEFIQRQPLVELKTNLTYNKRILLLCTYILITSACATKEDTISLSTSIIKTSNNSENIEVIVNSSSNWIIHNDCEWCNTSASEGGPGDTVVLTIKENNTGEDRIATITFACGTAKAELSITQEQRNMLILKQTQFNIDKTGGTINVELQANSEYEVNIEDGLDWISIIDTKSWESNLVSLSILPNESFNERKGNVYFSTSDNTTTITIIQEKNIPFISLSTKSVTLPHDGGNVNVTVSTNTFFKVKHNNADWVSYTSEASSTDYIITVSPNTTLYRRRLQVVFYNEEHLIADTLNICENASGIVGGHEYIDLGFESGTLWARCNIGASSPEEYGYYFAWGETAPKEGYINENYKYSVGNYMNVTKYILDKKDYLNNTIPGDGLTILTPEDDAATSNWGNYWRMPTESELKELVEFIKMQGKWEQKDEYNGVLGVMYSDNNNNDFFFLPGGGCMGYEGLEYENKCCYWSSSLGTHSYEAVSYMGYLCMMWPQTRRWAGLLVRPVVNTEKIKH